MWALMAGSRLVDSRTLIACVNSLTALHTYSNLLQYLLQLRPKCKEMDVTHYVLLWTVLQQNGVHLWAKCTRSRGNGMASEKFEKEVNLLLWNTTVDVVVKVHNKEQRGLRFHSAVADVRQASAGCSPANCKYDGVNAWLSWTCSLGEARTRWRHHWHANSSIQAAMSVGVDVQAGQHGLMQITYKSSVDWRWEKFVIPSSCIENNKVLVVVLTTFIFDLIVVYFLEWPHYLAKSKYSCSCATHSKSIQYKNDAKSFHYSYTTCSIYLPAMLSFSSCLCRLIRPTSDKGGGKCVCPCLSVCLLSKIAQKRMHGFGWNAACRQMSGHGRTD